MGAPRAANKTAAESPRRPIAVVARERSDGLQIIRRRLAGPAIGDDVIDDLLTLVKIVEPGPQGDCISKQGQEPGEVGFVPTGSLELAPE